MLDRKYFDEVVRRGGKMRDRFRFLPFLSAVALFSLMPASGRAQGLVTLLVGFRGRAADNVRAAPMLGLGVTPIRWAWGTLGLELSWAPRMSQSDSGAIPPGGPPCADPFGNLTICASQRAVYGESTLQIGVTVTVGPWQQRTAPFMEFALGHYGTTSKERYDIWDPAGAILPNFSLAGSQALKGAYARVGVGVYTKPWTRGPALMVSARYRWAQTGPLISEYSDPRNGAELVLGVRL